jgi:hypothetical protein
MAIERRGIAIKRKAKMKVSEQTVTATGTAARGEGLTERVTAESGVDWKRAPLSWWRNDSGDGEMIVHEQVVTVEMIFYILDPNHHETNSKDIDDDEDSRLSQSRSIQKIASLCLGK